jgi:hypothetical protein
VPSLERAFALPEVDGPSLPVSQDLDLDVARIGHVLLDVHGGIPEGAAGLTGRRAQGAFERRRLLHPPHSPPAASGGSLEEDRVADLGRPGPSLVEPR